MVGHNISTKNIVHNEIMKAYLMVFILYTGCVSPIEIGHSHDASEYVINCILRPGQGVKLSLGQTYAIDDSNVANPITDAIVSITDDSGNVAFLEYIEDSVYSNSTFNFNAGSTYYLEVTLANGHKLESQTSIPYPVYINSAKGIWPAGYDEYGDAMTEYKIDFSDPEGTDNFYDMFIFSIDEDHKFIDFLTTESCVEIDPIILAEGLEEFQNTSFLFTDALIDGERYELKLRELPMGYGSVPPPIDFANELTQGGSHVLLRQCSWEYYNFRKSWVRHLYHQQSRPILLNSGFTIGDILEFLFKGGVEPLRSNIEGGLGVFAGYNETFLKLDRIKLDD